jgi:hypothetical protein
MQVVGLICHMLGCRRRGGVLKNEIKGCYLHMRAQGHLENGEFSQNSLCRMNERMI